MPKRVPAKSKGSPRAWPLLALGVCFLLSGGCSISGRPDARPPSGNGAVNRRNQLWQVTVRQSTRRRPATRPATRPVASGPAASRPATTRPAGSQPAATRPSLPPLEFQTPRLAAAQRASTQAAEMLEPITEPYRINYLNVIRITYLKSPQVRASRDEMIAARYGLKEFQANLSRFEPYLRVDGAGSQYPERRDSRGYEGEVVGGVDRETFDGAVFRVEGGVNASRYTFDPTDDKPAETQSGSGAVVRARVEIPFVGSRKRQARTIQQAYQESTARQAMLEYLGDYRTYVSSALLHYRQVILYLHHMRAYEDRIAAIEALLALPNLSDMDRMRLQTALGQARVDHGELQASYWTSLLSLLQELGIRPGEQYILEETKELPLRFLTQVEAPDGVRQLLAEAYENNPRFAVLEDAIRNAELKRSQAILGTYDVTAYFEGAHFALGAPDFDDRVGGWLLTAGVTVRLNDRRVLTESLKKAEAEIRSYRAQIEAEENDTRNQITIRADRLKSYYRSRRQIVENIERARAQFEERCEAYFWRQVGRMSIDDVLTSLSMLTDAQIQLANNLNQITDAENDLVVATGEVYRLVGIRLEDRGKGMELAETPSTQPAPVPSRPAP